MGKPFSARLPIAALRSLPGPPRAHARPGLTPPAPPRPSPPRGRGDPLPPARAQATRGDPRRTRPRPGAAGPAAQRAAGRRSGGNRALTLSMVPGSRRSRRRQSTTPSFREDWRNPSGSEMVFLGDSSTPRAISHVTVCSAEFMAAAAAGRGSRHPAPRVGFVSPRAGASGGGRRRPHVNADDDAAAPPPPLQTHAAAVPPPPRPRAAAAAAAP